MDVLRMTRDREDEFVPIDELEQAVDLYAEAIRHFCG